MALIELLPTRYRIEVPSLPLMTELLRDAGLPPDNGSIWNRLFPHRPMPLSPSCGYAVEVMIARTIEAESAKESCYDAFRKLGINFAQVREQVIFARHYADVVRSMQHIFVECSPWRKSDAHLNTYTLGVRDDDALFIEVDSRGSGSRCAGWNFLVKEFDWDQKEE